MCCFTCTVFWYGAFLQIVLQEQRYVTKNKNLKYKLRQAKFEINGFKNVLDSVGQIECHTSNMTLRPVLCYDTTETIWMNALTIGYKLQHSE